MDGMSERGGICDIALPSHPARAAQLSLEFRLPNHHVGPMVGDDAQMDKGPGSGKRITGLTETLLSLTEDDATPADGPQTDLSLADLVARLDNRARGVLMILFALPNCLPGPPGTSAVTGFPLLFLTLQMALNRPPWLPGFIARRTVSRHGLARVLNRAAPWLRRVELLIRPRLTVLTSQTAERLIGALGMVLAATIMLPIPLGNMLPAIALIVFSLGFIGRDGVWILFGLALVCLAATVLALAGWAAFVAMTQVWAGWFAGSAPP